MITPQKIIPINRYKVPENLVGVREVICDPRPDGTITGMIAIDGYYHVPGSRVQLRQIRTYDVKQEEQALARARADGLAQPLMLEHYLDEPQPCILHNFQLPANVRSKGFRADLLKRLGLTSQ